MFYESTRSWPGCDWRTTELGCQGQEEGEVGPSFPTPRGLEEVPVPTFLMFLLQDNFDCCAACPLWLKVARDEVQRGAEPGGGWGAQASLPPAVP